MFQSKLHVLKKIVFLLFIASILSTSIYAQEAENDTILDTFTKLEVNQTISPEKEVPVHTSDFYADEYFDVIGRGLIRTWISLYRAEDITEFALGDMIPIYNYENGALVYLEDMADCPIYIGSEAVGVLGIVFQEDSDPAFSVSQDWEEQYNDFVDSGAQEVCLIAAENKFYFKSKSAVSLIYKLPHVTPRTVLSDEDILNIDDEQIYYASTSKRYAL